MKGVKGEPWLSCLGSLDVVDGMSCDYMHEVLLGVVKLLLSLWTEVSRCSGLSCDIRQYLLQIDSCIDQIEVPSEISRLPRGIQDHLKNWKGTSTITITSMCCFTGEALVTPCSPPRLNVPKFLTCMTEIQHLHQLPKKVIRRGLSGAKLLRNLRKVSSNRCFLPTRN